MSRRQRKLKNYLLKPSFQMKYTTMVVLVTVAVASLLGYQAYRYSKGQTQALTAQLVLQADMDGTTVQELEKYAEAEDRRVLMAIVGGIVVLAFVLGVTGIVVTHRVVGPAYRIELLLDGLAQGRLRLAGRIRKGDELQEVFEALERAVDGMRGQRQRELEALQAAVATMKAKNQDVSALETVIAQIQDQL